MRNLLLIISLSAFFAACSHLKPVESLSGNVIPSKLSEKKIVKGITLGGTARGWVINPDKDKSKTLTGTLMLRKHTVVVSIPYTNESYDIVYVSSENLNYDSTQNKIHRNYLKWVINLRQAINVNLAILANE